MCCFSAKTVVHGTRIFARKIAPDRQVLAYQMQYSAEAPTAMILPLPVALPAREDSVRFRDLKSYPELFDALERGFPEPAPSRSIFSGEAKGVAAAAPPLAVHEVGDFIASFVPSVGDFDRVDPRFVISQDVWARIPAYRDYGFAVFQLKELSGAPHPMAFEFDTRMRAAVFFPTVHIHDGTVHAKDEFDHALYVQEASFDGRVASYDGPDHVDAHTGFVRSSGEARAFVDAERAGSLVDGSLLVHKATLRGLLPNQDTTYDFASIATRAGAGYGRCDVGPNASSSWAPAASVLSALGWIIRRRNARPSRGS